MKKKFILTLTSIALIGGLAIGGAISYANFAATDNVEEPVASTAGMVKKTIFLSPSIWKVDGAEFYLYDNTHNEWIAQTKEVEPTINHSDGINSSTPTLVVFEIYVNNYTNESSSEVGPVTSFYFARMNPNYPGVVPSNEARWNYTDSITVTSNINYYCIEGWGSGDFSTNEIIQNPNGTLRYRI